MKPKTVIPANKRLLEGIHFYIENGLYVFTEKYLKERGFCCQSGCRHCPYGFEKGKKEQKSIIQKPS